MLLLLPLIIFLLPCCRTLSIFFVILSSDLYDRVYFYMSKISQIHTTIMDIGNALPTAVKNTTQQQEML